VFTCVLKKDGSFVCFAFGAGCDAGLCVC